MTPPALAGPRRLWWTQPLPLVLLLVPGTLALALGVDDAEFRAQFRSPRSLDRDSARLMLAGALTLALGAGLAQLLVRSSAGAARTADPNGWTSWPPARLERLRAASTWLFRVTLAGYAVWLLAAVARGLRPAAVLDALTSGVAGAAAVEGYFATVPGVTTLTQVGIAYVVTGALLVLHDRDRTAARRTGVLLLLALARAHLLTERLALLELAVPLLVVLGAAALGSARRAIRVTARAAPVVLVPALVVVFALFEASRSFVFLGAGRQQTVLEFGADRLAGYYATSYNNGHLLLHDRRLRDALPYGSLEAFWTAPLVEPSGLYEALNGYSFPSAFAERLEQAGSAEFNSPGGLALPFVDFGLVGGLLLLAALGVLAGLAAERFAAGDLVGVLVYPPVVTGLLELPRYLYWTQGRFVVPLVALLLTVWAVRRADEPPAPTAPTRPTAQWLPSTVSTTPDTARSADSGR